MNYVYLLRCADGSLYCGWTTDLSTRVKAHNSGQGAKYTRSRRPVELVYAEEYEDRHEALRREVHIKRMSREEKLAMISAAAEKDVLIETPRLILRPFTDNDLDIIFALYSDEEIMRYMPCDIMDRERAKEHLQTIVSDWQAAPCVSMEMAVILREENRKIGRARFHIDRDTDTALIGYLLLKPYWGQHYATEMVKALIGYAFDTLCVHRVSALCHPDNIGSCRVLEKCGMRREAHYLSKCRYIKYGISRWEDELEYALLDTEWRE